MTAMIDAIESRMNAAMVEVDGKYGVCKGAPMCAPTKVVLDTDKELPQLEQVVERTEVLTAARIGSVLQTECSL